MDENFSFFFNNEKQQKEYLSELVPGVTGKSKSKVSASISPVMKIQHVFHSYLTIISYYCYVTY